MRRWVERSPTSVPWGGQEHRGLQARSPIRRHTLYDEAKATLAFHQTMPDQLTVLRHAELLPLTESCVEAQFKALSGPISLRQVATP
ncbi:hypothetical protein [Phormidium tenue]|uniref:hypothetical protein n=1 Tax=Phormidium tenue TaxID=126344 RepID=UPI001115161A|nr:hypothetical protein [Phormidium tenue]MBD2231217.1 hypothetical protein [Phormidium tenue FACHB-1052]